MKTVEWNKIVRQLIAASGVMALTTQTGIIDGWIGPNMARLTEANATIPLTLSEASWLVSCLKLGRFASVILVPMFIELLGSKNGILCAFIPVSAAWMLTMAATSAMYLYVARFLSGITLNLAFSCAPLYLAEISTPSFRGTFLAIASVGWPLGTLVSAVAEVYLSEFTSNLIYLLPCLLAMFLFTWLPESPYQLVKHELMGEAAKSLAWYRGHNEIDAEMEEIVEYVESTSAVTLAERMRQLRSPPVRKAVLLVLLVCVLPHVCGVFNVFYYMEILLTNGKSYLVDPSNMMIYTNAILLVFNIAAINLLDKLGRRILLIVSCAVMTTALVGLGLHYYLLNKMEVDPEIIQELPIASIIVLLVAFSIGSSAVMNTLLGELFPAGVKSTVATITTCGSAFAALVSTKTYQPLIDAIGETYTFWIYAAFMALAIPVFIFFLPETKGKSLQEIQKFLHEKSVVNK